jgi:hypothetical protein
MSFINKRDHSWNLSIVRIIMTRLNRGFLKRRRYALKVWRQPSQRSIAFPNLWHNLTSIYRRSGLGWNHQIYKMIVYGCTSSGSVPCDKGSPSSSVPIAVFDIPTVRNSMCESSGLELLYPWSSVKVAPRLRNAAWRILSTIRDVRTE